MLLVSKKEAGSPAGRHGQVLVCPYCKARKRLASQFPAPGSQLLRWDWAQYRGWTACLDVGQAPNLVTNLSCDFVWVFPLWEPQSPIPKARDKLQRICCLQGWGNPSWLERSLSSFQPLLQGSPGLEPHILFLYPSTRNHLHSYPTSCLALDPEPPGSFYHVDSTTTGALIIPCHR